MVYFVNMLCVCYKAIMLNYSATISVAISTLPRVVHKIFNLIVNLFSPFPQRMTFLCCAIVVAIFHFPFAAFSHLSQLIVQLWRYQPLAGTIWSICLSNCLFLPLCCISLFISYDFFLSAAEKCNFAQGKYELLCSNFITYRVYFIYFCCLFQLVHNSTKSTATTTIATRIKRNTL